MKGLFRRLLPNTKIFNCTGIKNLENYDSYYEEVFSRVVII